MTVLKLKSLIASNIYIRFSVEPLYDDTIHKKVHDTGFYTHVLSMFYLPLVCSSDFHNLSLGFYYIVQALSLVMLYH